MEAILILKCVGVVFFSVTSILALLVMLRVISKPNEYKMNKERTGGVAKAVLGKVDTFHHGSRDSSVHAGIIVDSKTNSWVEQGALSDGSIDSVLAK